MSGTRSRFTLITLLFATMLGTIATIQPAYASTSRQGAAVCSCLSYFQRNHGLPATGDASFPAANYYDFLSSYKGTLAPRGYKLEKITPATSKPGNLVGAGMIWARNSHGASGAGHIATVTKASYNSKTKRWSIEFRDANSSYDLVRGPFTDRNCTNVAIRKIELTSFNGLTFFKWSRK